MYAFQMSESESPARPRSRGRGQAECASVIEYPWMQSQWFYRGLYYCTAVRIQTDTRKLRRVTSDDWYTNPNPDPHAPSKVSISSSRHVPHLCTPPSPSPPPVHHPVCRDMGRDTQRVGCGEGLTLGLW